MPKQSNLTQAMGTVVNQQKGPAPWTGRANYTTMEKIPTEGEVLAGTFFLNELDEVAESILGHSRPIGLFGLTRVW
jgi:hypothetical protein